MYVCMYVCMYVRTYVRTYVRMYVRTYVCLYVDNRRGSDNGGGRANLGFVGALQAKQTNVNKQSDIQNNNNDTYFNTYIYIYIYIYIYAHSCYIILHYITSYCIILLFFS